MTDGANQTPPRSELSLRVMSAAVLVAFAVVTLWWGGWPFALVWTLLGAIAAFEWSRIISGRSYWDWIDLLAAAQVVTVGVIAGLGWFLIALAALVGFAALSFRSHRGEHPILSVTGILYAGAIALAPIYLRAQAGLGVALIAWCFAVVWSTDIAAYFAGRKFGGPKLWPAVSPKKTWSGAVGGAVAGVAGALAVALLSGILGAPWPLGAAATMLAALVCSAAGQFGDLAESALKRRFGVKDSGSLIPGHGGVLDRLDAFVVVATLVALAVTVLP